MRLKTFFIVTLLALSVCATAIASPTLAKDDTGEEVLILQQKLYLIGYTITEFDGVFGEETERAVLEFQRDNGIIDTGIVANVTWRALRDAEPIAGRSIDDIEITMRNEPVNHENIIAPNGILFISQADGEALINTAEKYIGVPYVFGGTTPSGFDCSGFLQYVFEEVGFIIPRLADEQYLLGKSASVSQLEVGDLVFFETYTDGVSHCGFYVGGRKFLHVSASRGVRVDSLDSDYWAPRFVGARKIVA